MLIFKLSRNFIRSLFVSVINIFNPIHIGFITELNHLKNQIPVQIFYSLLGRIINISMDLDNWLDRLPIYLEIKKWDCRNIECTNFPIYFLFYSANLPFVILKHFYHIRIGIIISFLNIFSCKVNNLIRWVELLLVVINSFPSDILVCIVLKKDKIRLLSYITIRILFK